MKRFLFLALILALVQGLTQQLRCEIDLELVWKKYMFDIQTYITCAKFSADGNYVYCAVGNKIKKMDANTGEFISTFGNYKVSDIYDMNISKLGNYIVTSDGGGGINIWDVNQEKAIKFIDYPGGTWYQGIYAVDISPDEKYIYYYLCEGTDGEIKNIVVYDLLLDKEVNRFSTPGNRTTIRCSNNGKYLAVGYSYIYDKQDYQRISLYDTETLKEIAVVQDVEGKDGGYRHIDFSPNDNYLTYVRDVPYDGGIYDIINKKRIMESKINMLCFNIKFLPDSFHYFTQYYIDNSGDIKDILELNNLDKNIKSYDLSGSIIEIYGTIENWKMFCGVGNDTFYVFKNTETDVKANEENTRTFSVNYSNDILKLYLDEMPSTYFDLSIYDLAGKIIYTQKIVHISSDVTYNINLVLPTGIYICNIKTENKEYSQKFEVLR